MTRRTAAWADVTGAAGGISADELWAAGFEMGRLDQQLAALVLRDRKVGLTIRGINRDVAAAIARQYVYELHVQAVDEPGRVWAEFWPTDTSRPGSSRPAPTSPRCPPECAVGARQRMEAAAPPRHAPDVESCAHRVPTTEVTDVESLGLRACERQPTPGV
jgi:hypothetical protein